MLERLLITLAALLLLMGTGRRILAQEEAADEELEALRRAAATEAVQEPVVDEEAAETTFKSRGLGLQALHPEISVTGGFMGTARDGDDVEEHWDFNFRGLGIHLEAYLDPYSRFKAAVPVSGEGAELG
ncbi:MAG: hypothetical protein ACYSU0_03490, partial [Planctomycetota bacterium]